MSPMSTSDYRLPQVSSWTLHPDGFVVKGSNMVPHASHGGYSWKALWNNWSTIWADWLRPQIDYAARAGSNTVRFFGSHLALLDGSLTNSQMTAQWQQWADYCVSKGLALYPCLGDDFLETEPAANIAATSAQQATVLHAYRSRCIGMDNLQERNTYQAANAATISTAVRAVTTIPLAYSLSNGVGYYAGASDFGDFHSYAKGVTRSTLANFWNTNPTVRVLGGEFGIQSDQTAAAQDDYYGYMLDLVNNYVGPAGQRLSGVCQWAIVDQADPIGWGLWDSTFTTERTAETAGWRRFPTVRW